MLQVGHLPNEGERRVLDAILIASADHGAGAPSAAAARIVASGNRESIAAPIAAGILAIGDFHGGAGQACMEMIARGLEMAHKESLGYDQAARLLIQETRAAG